MSTRLYKISLLVMLCLSLSIFCWFTFSSNSSETPSYAHLDNSIGHVKPDPESDFLKKLQAILDDTSTDPMTVESATASGAHIIRIHSDPQQLQARQEQIQKTLQESTSLNEVRKVAYVREYFELRKQEKRLNKKGEVE